MLGQPGHRGVHYGQPGRKVSRRWAIVLQWLVIFLPSERHKAVRLCQLSADSAWVAPKENNNLGGLLALRFPLEGQIACYLRVTLERAFLHRLLGHVCGKVRCARKSRSLEQGFQSEPKVPTAFRQYYFTCALDLQEEPGQSFRETAACS